MTPFEIAVTNGGDRVVRLAVEGEIDMSTSPQLLDSVLSVALAHDRHHIVMDLRDVRFLDSSGLAAIVQANKSVRDLNAHLILCNPSRTVRRMFEVTGLDDVLDVRNGWAATSPTAASEPGPSGT